MASQLSARVDIELGETNTSATPVPTVVRAARPARVPVKAAGAFSPNLTADFPIIVLVFGAAVPACKALRALSALDTQLNTPSPGVAYVAIVSATLPAARSGRNPVASLRDSNASVVAS